MICCPLNYSEYFLVSNVLVIWYWIKNPHVYRENIMKYIINIPLQMCIKFHVRLCTTKICYIFRRTSTIQYNLYPFIRDTFPRTINFVYNPSSPVYLPTADAVYHIHIYICVCVNNNNINHQHCSIIYAYNTRLKEK